MQHDLITTIVGTLPTLFGVIIAIWQISRLQDQIGRFQDQLNKRIDDRRDTLRAEIRASIAEARFK